MEFKRLVPGLTLTIGKTISRIFLVQRNDQMHQVYLCFGDGSHYELFGNGTLSGLRGPDKLDAEAVRALIERDARSPGFQWRELPETGAVEP